MRHVTCAARYKQLYTAVHVLFCDCSRFYAVRRSCLGHPVALVVIASMPNSPRSGLTDQGATLCISIPRIKCTVPHMLLLGQHTNCDGTCAANLELSGISRESAAPSR